MFHKPELLGHLGMISLINHDSRVRENSEVVTIYPYDHLLSSIIIYYYHLLSSIIIYDHLWLSIIIYYHLLSFMIIYDYLLLSSIIIYYHLWSSMIIYYPMISYIFPFIPIYCWWYLVFAVAHPIPYIYTYIYIYIIWSQIAGALVIPHIISTGWWFQPLWKIWVSWDDDIPNMWKNNPVMFQTANQINIVIIHS